MGGYFRFDFNDKEFGRRKGRYRRAAECRTYSLGVQGQRYRWCDCGTREKISGARATIPPDTFKPGNPRMALRDVQVLRGMRQHWLVASWVWKVCLQTIVVLLSQAGEDSIYVTCADGDAWASFRAILEVLRATASEEQRWGRCSKELYTYFRPLESVFRPPG